MDEAVSVLSRTKLSLERLQNFVPKSLVQAERLGAISFESAVDPATKLVNHFKLLPVGALDQFAESELATIGSLCDSVFAVLKEVLDFDTDAGDNKARQQALVEKLRNIFQSIFTQSHLLIAYSTARTVDFNKLDEQGRAAVQSISDQSEKIVADLAEKQVAIDRILEDVRNVAAEQGVTLQAKFFGDEAQRHFDVSAKWLVASLVATVIVIAYSAFTLFFSKIPLLTAVDPASAIQITTSKLLIFFVLVYGLFQCVRNYSANMHIGVVNKHRQNSLLTYRTLTEASGTAEGREIVLQHAAAAIYAPTDTGYVRKEDTGIQGLSD